MKVLHIVGDSKFGGGTVIIVQLAQLAQQIGWQVDILSTDLETQKQAGQLGIGVKKLDVIWRETRPLRDLQGLYNLVSFLRNSDYALVHTHTSKGGGVGRLAARIAKVPVIVHTVHGFAFHEGSPCFQIWLYASLERLAARWCDRIVTVSHFHRDWALELGIGNLHKVLAIPNGIPKKRTEPTRPAAQVRGELGVAPDELVILSTGRLATQKGLEDLIDAVPLLNEGLHCSFRVLLAGEGDLRSDLESRIKNLGLQEQVIFLGFREDIGDLLAASDIVTLPSLREGLSIALLEAMAAGKPVVTTTIGSNCEVLHHGETGLLVPPRSPQKLAEALSILGRDEAFRKRLGLRAQQVYRELYTLEHMLQAYQAMYETLCEEKGISG